MEILIWIALIAAIVFFFVSKKKKKKKPEPEPEPVIIPEPDYPIVIINPDYPNVVLDTDEFSYELDNAQWLIGYNPKFRNVRAIIQTGGKVESVADTQSLLDRLKDPTPLIRGAESFTDLDGMSEGAERIIQLAEMASPGNPLRIRVGGAVSTVVQAMRARNEICGNISIYGIGSWNWGIPDNRAPKEMAIAAKAFMPFADKVAESFIDHSGFRGIFEGGNSQEYKDMHNWMISEKNPFAHIWRDFVITIEPTKPFKMGDAPACYFDLMAETHMMALKKMFNKKIGNVHFAEGSQAASIMRSKRVHMYNHIKSAMLFKYQRYWQQ